MKHFNFRQLAGLLTPLLLLCGCANAQFAPLPATSAAPSAREAHFLVFGDWGTGGEQQKSVAEAMARYADNAKTSNPIRFVISTGDNFYEKGVTGIDDPQWQEKFEKMYDPRRLGVPFFSVLGNHDWGFDPLAQILYARKPGTRWQMDGFYYKRSLTLPNQSAPLADFFFVDTDLWAYDLKRLADKQMQWLEEGLKSSKAPWQIVVGHHPLYSNGAHGQDAAVLKMRESLSPLFAKYGVDAYLCGHDHDLQRIEVPSHPTTFIVSGAGGKIRKKAFENWGPFFASSPGFVAVKVSAQTMHFQFLNDKGETLHQYSCVPVAAMPAALAAPATAPATTPAKQDKDD